MRYRSALVLAALAFFGSGCGAQRPVLYPNAQVEKGSSQADIDDCVARAQQYVDSGGQGKEVARDTAIGAASGAAIGGVGGAIYGDAGRGAAAGAATGATAGLLHNVFKASEPTPIFKNFVERCLRERGYETIGWQ